MKRAFFLNMAGVTALLALNGCEVKTGAAAPGKPDQSQKEKEKAGDRRYLVTLAKTQVKPLTYEIEATGALQADDIFRIDAQVSGIVQDVNFKEGDEVTPQTVLCRTSPETYRLAEQKAKDAWQKALADLADTERRTRNDIARARVKIAQAERDVARRRPGYESHAISQDEFLAVQDKYEQDAVELKDAEDAAKTYVETMRALARQKETEWKQAGEDLRKSAVLSPVAGIIDQRLISNGTLAVPGSTPVAQVVSKGLKLKFLVPEQQSAHVAQTSQVKFRVMAYPGRDFDASTHYISNIADPKTRMVTCWARVTPPADVVLKSGFFATVKIVTEEKKSAVVIPLNAAQPTEYGFVVFVAERTAEPADGKPAFKASRRKITLGLQLADKAVEVIDGLKEGEMIAVEGANALQDGVLLKEAEQQH